MSEPKFLAIVTRLTERRFSAGAEVPGDIYQFECEAFFVRAETSGSIYPCECEALFDQNRNSWRYFAV